MQLNFKKMHGLGNDFIIPEGDFNENEDLAELAKVLCNRHTGIGADGLLIVCSSDIADLKMRIINSDGSEAEMCGNGIRCFAKYVFENNIINKNNFTIETLAGIITPELFVVDGKVFRVKVNMDVAKYMNSDEEIIDHINEINFNRINKKLTISDQNIDVSSVFMGVPHSMIFVDNINFEEVENLGSKIENHPEFPSGTNVNFVKVINENEITISTWERGAGRTLACGTGSCASALTSFFTGMTNSKVIVHLELGDLEIEIKENAIYMTGPAETVFEGSLKL